MCFEGGQGVPFQRVDLCFKISRKTVVAIRKSISSIVHSEPLSMLDVIFFVQKFVGIKILI